MKINYDYLNELLLKEQLTDDEKIYILGVVKLLNNILDNELKKEIDKELNDTIKLKNKIKIKN
jgi:hypothetical protein